MEENEFKDDINIQMLLKLFKSFPLFFKDVICFIETQKPDKQKSDEEKYYLQKINESFDSLDKNISNLDELFDKLEGAKINNASLEVNEITFERSNITHHLDDFYGSSNSIENQTESIRYSNQKNNFIKTFISCINNIFEEFNDLLNSNKEISYPYRINESSIESEDNIKFLELINNMYKDLKQNISIFNNIESKEKILNSSIIEQKEETNIADANWIEAIEIDSSEDLKSNKEKPHTINTIKINCENFDLSIFIDMKLNFLQKLELKENKIRDITPLKNCGFAELKYLDLEENELDNKSLDVLLELNIPGIIYLNLFNNKITSIRIFDLLEHYKTIRTFYMGKNRLDKKELMNNQKDFYVDNNLDELGLTYIFDNETIGFIKHLNLKNIKILYLSGNNLTSLSGLKNIKFNRLDELWVKGNQICDINAIKDLPNKDIIKSINLTFNKINKINDTIFDTLKLFSKLKSINIKSNNVNYKDCSEIIDKIKEMGIKLLIDKN